MNEQLEALISCRRVWKVFGVQSNKKILHRVRRSRFHEGKIRKNDVIAVKDVSFDVYPGEIFAVMGLSGSGKSTLVRCMTRLIEPTQGQIFINGEDVMRMGKIQLRELRRHHVSMVFQQFGLFPHRKVIENAAYGLEVRGVKKAERQQRAQEMLDLVGLSGWEGRYPHELSGGMQQRVGLARALAVDPSILLCDEPFSALDPLIRREMQNELLRLQRMMKKTMVFITHDFLEATKLGDRIAIMKEGEIVQIGTPQQIVANPVDNYVREFAKDVPRSRVLTAQSIMKEDRSAVIEANTSTCMPQTTLEALIPMVLKGNRALVVVDERNEPMGVVDQEMVMLAIAGQS